MTDELRPLIPLAQLLERLAGSYTAAAEWTREIARSDTLDALRVHGVADDHATAVRQLAAECGLLDPGRHTELVPARLSQLQVLLDVLDGLDPPPAAPPSERPLVFTTPRAAAHLVAPPVRRLDLLVQDVIAGADSELHIGGPFWNRHGCDLLREVLLPAVAERQVAVHFYAHDPSSRAQPLNDLVKDCADYGRTSLYWWTGANPGMMHAKFVVADRATGYFGSANLSSLGLQEHFEIGMALGSTQASSLVDLCTRLRQEGFFTQVTKGPGRAPDPLVLLETADGKRRFGQLRSWRTTRDGRREADVLCRLSDDAPRPARIRVDESRIRLIPGVDYANVPTAGGARADDGETEGTG
ncbi:phospholipase D-like domain-containing protein [Streptomyces sp. NPDC048270]|uniref:phospholipase D-like domain-containing protein n=1 Tax=Streptomyces sp. NPDC048270 TaxID=3154615 RepID=UPI0033F8D75C